MKNKLRLKQYITSILIVFICLFVMFLILNIYEYKTYTKNFNNKISAIVTLVKDKYPEITDKEIIEIINSNKQSDDFFSLNMELISIIKQYYWKMIRAIIPF